MENENNRHFPFGRKEAEGFAAHVDASAGTEQPPGLLSMVPLGAGKTSPYMPTSSRAPRGEPQAMTPPHTASPHRYAPATERETVVLTPRTRP